MAFGHVNTFYFPSSANAGASLWGTDVRLLRDTADAATDALTITSHGTSGTGVRRTLDPYSTSTADGVEANFGWAVTPSDMGSTADANRVMLAGTHTFTFRAVSSFLTGAAGDFIAFIYRVGPSPTFTRTLIASGTTNVNIPAVTAGTVNFTITGVPEIVLAAGETIQYSVERTANGVILTGHTITFSMGTQGGVAIRVDHPGLVTRYPRALADSAPAVTEAMTRVAMFPRSLADSAPAADAITRLSNYSRYLNDNAPATDALTRVASFPRALADASPAPADGLRRLVGFNRRLDDSAPVTDAVARQITTLRLLTDSAPASDSLNRTLALNRRLDDNAPMVADNLGRYYIANRQLADSAPSVADSIQRLVAYNRRLDDSAPVTDALTRKATYARQLEDDLTTGGGTVVRKIFTIFDD